MAGRVVQERGTGMLYHGRYEGRHGKGSMARERMSSKRGQKRVYACLCSRYAHNAHRSLPRADAASRRAPLLCLRRRTELMPQALLQDYQKLLSSAPVRRLNPAKVAQSRFLNNRLVEVVAFMENIAVKDSVEKASTETAEHGAGVRWCNESTRARQCCARCHVEAGRVKVHTALPTSCCFCCVL